MASALTWYGVGLTDVGRKRASNQDAMVILNPLGVWGIADGMGGLPGGDVASELAIGTATEFLRERLGDASPAVFDNDGIEAEALLHDAIKLSNQAVRKEAHRDPKLFGMGTTIVLLCLVPGAKTVASIAHVGDSRAYLLHDGTLTRLTRDHSAVEEYIRRGLITAEQAINHPHKHILSRAIGVSDRVDPDLVTRALEPHDLILLCTDGLTKMIKDDELQQILIKTGPKPETICRRLVDEANERGGDDNVTVVVVKAAEQKLAARP